MFINRNNIDDEDENNNLFKVKKMLIFLLAGILFLVIIFIIVKARDNNSISYENKLYYITLFGENKMTVYLNEEYDEPGYSGKDDTGKDLTSKVLVVNNIDNSKIGTYKVSYTLGNITKERIVNVIEKPIGATNIHLYGDLNVFLYIGEKYVEKGYEVIDSIDGAKLNDQVKINSDVDTSKEGIYKVKYSVVNSSGVTTSSERTVIVMDREISLLPSNTEDTNNNVKINIYIKDELFDYLLLPDKTQIKERTSSYEVSSNGTYKFIMYNTKGESKEKSITISNIDKEAPSGSCSGTHQNGVTNINVNASDNNGISRYVINGTNYTTNTIMINEELSNASVTIYDNAGNSKTISCTLTNKNTSTTNITTTTMTTTTTTTVPITSKPTYIVPVDTSHYCKNNGIRSTHTKRIATDNLGCPFYYSNIRQTYVYANAEIADNLHEILKNICGYVNSVSWMDRIQHAGIKNSSGQPGQGNLHYYGLAIDLNTEWKYTANGKTYRPYASQGTSAWNNYQKFVCEVCNGEEDCPYNVNYIIFKRFFEGNGWCWGGNWGPTSFDPMHMEVRDNNKCLTNKRQKIKC